MFNEEIYQKLCEEFAEDKMVLVCDIISTLYHIKFNAIPHLDSFNEFDYERQWWMNKRNDLINAKEVI